MFLLHWVLFVTGLSLGSCRQHFGEKDCGSKAKILDIQFSSCTSSPCQLKRGGTYDVAVKFIPSRASQTLDFNVSVKLIFWNISIISGNACVGLLGSGAACPYSAHIPIEYKRTIKIEKNARDVPGPITIKLKDDAGVVQVCFVTKVQIV